MGTSKIKLQLYLERELEEDFDLLYKLWEIRCKRRGVSSSKSKFMDSIFREYVERERDRLRKEVVVGKE